MLEKLKYCPYCGSTDLSHYEDDVTLAIFCSRCGLRSPLVLKSAYPDPKSETEFRWNAMPRKLKWTKEKPTEPGIYFYRKNIDALFTVIGVYEDKDITLCYVMLGSKKIKLIEYLQGEFAGPMPEPME